MSEFCEQKGIKREADSKLPTTFWAEAVNTISNVQNRVPVFSGTNSNDLVGTEENIGVGHSSKETRSSQDYIVMPLWKDDSLFDSSFKNASNNEPQPSSDAEKINDEGVNKESGIDDQKRPKNSTQDVNTARPKLDMSNITTTYPVPFAPNTRIHKDHSLNHVIGDVQYGVLTRRMIKTTNEQGFIKAMQKELLQFKLQQVWTLVDLPYGKRAIGTKWMYMNKKDERDLNFEIITNAITTRSGKTCEGPSTPLVPTTVVSTPLKEPEQNPEMSMDKVQKPGSKSTAQVPPPEDHDSIFIEIPRSRAKKTVQEPDSPEPNSYQPKLPYPERMKVREKDTPSAQQSRNKEKLEEIAITTVNAECSTIILNKVPEKLKDLEKFLIPCALHKLDRTNALANSGASINLLPHSIYKQLGLGALKPTRMTLELANRFVTHPMGIAEDVVVRVDGFTFLADFVVVNFKPDPRVPIILGRPFLRTAKALIDLYEEKLTLRVGSDELVFYAEKSEKSKNKQFAHAISIIDFLKDEPFSGSTTIHSDALPPSSSPVKTSDNLEEFADELTLLDSFPPGNDDSVLKKDVHEENFQVYSNPLFEFDDHFTSSNVNPLFNEMVEDVKNNNST
ncbi:reverse transcriptase domain-containing protein [Tanacetum coccineum]